MYTITLCVLIYYVQYKTYMEKIFREKKKNKEKIFREKIKTNRKFHTSLAHLAHPLVCTTYPLHISETTVLNKDLWQAPEEGRTSINS